MSIFSKLKNLTYAIDDDLSAVLERDPAARTKIEIILTYPGIHARTLHRASHSLWQGGYLT